MIYSNKMRIKEIILYWSLAIFIIIIYNLILFNQNVVDFIINNIILITIFIGLYSLLENVPIKILEEKVFIPKYHFIIYFYKYCIYSSQIVKIEYSRRNIHIILKDGNTITLRRNKIFNKDNLYNIFREYSKDYNIKMEKAF